MIGEMQRRIAATAVNRIAPRIQPGIVQLAESCDYAHDVRADRWQYAVEIDSLRKLGLTTGDLEWLVGNGYAEHAREVTKPDDRTRKFRGGRKLVFTERTCFVVTAAGMSLTTVEVVRPAAARRAASQLAHRRPCDSAGIASRPQLARAIGAIDACQSVRWGRQCARFGTSPSRSRFS